MAKGDIKILSTQHLESEKTLLIRYFISTPGTWIYSLCECGYRNVCSSDWTIMIPNHQHPQHTDARTEQPLVVTKGGRLGTFAWNYGGIPGVSKEDFDDKHSYLVQLTVVDEAACKDPGKRPIYVHADRTVEIDHTGMSGSYTGKTGIILTPGKKGPKPSYPPNPGNPGNPGWGTGTGIKDPDLITRPTNPVDPDRRGGTNAGSVLYVGLDPYVPGKVVGNRGVNVEPVYGEPRPIKVKGMNSKDTEIKPDPTTKERIPGIGVGPTSPDVKIKDSKPNKSIGVNIVNLEDTITKDKFSRSAQIDVVTTSFTYEVAPLANIPNLSNNNGEGIKTPDVGVSEASTAGENKFTNGINSSSNGNNTYDLNQTIGDVNLKVFPNTVSPGKNITLLSSFVPNAETIVAGEVIINDQSKSYPVYRGEFGLATPSSPCQINDVFTTESLVPGVITFTVVYKTEDGSIAGIKTDTVFLLDSTESDQSLQSTYTLPTVTDVSEGLRKYGSYSATPIEVQLPLNSKRYIRLTRTNDTNWLGTTIGNLLDLSGGETFSQRALVNPGGSSSADLWNFESSIQNLIPPEGAYITTTDISSTVSDFFARPATNDYGILFTRNVGSAESPSFYTDVYNLDKRDDYYFSCAITTPYGISDKKTIRINIWGYTQNGSYVYDVSNKEWTLTEPTEAVFAGNTKPFRVGFPFSTKDKIFDNDYPTYFRVEVKYIDDTSIADEDKPIHIASDPVITTKSSMSVLAVPTSSDQQYSIEIYDANMLFDSDGRTTLDSDTKDRLPRGGVLADVKPLAISSSSLKAYSGEGAAGIEPFDSSLYKDLVIAISRSTEGLTETDTVNLFISDYFKIRELGDPERTAASIELDTTVYNILTPHPRETIGVIVRGYEENAIPDTLNIIYAVANSKGRVTVDLDGYVNPGNWICVLSYPYKIGTSEIGSKRIDDA